MPGELAIKVEGLAAFRRDLRRLDRDALSEMRVTLRRAADVVARDAALLAPRRTGALAASYRPFTRGNLAGVRSNLPYAGVVEYGGTIEPRGVPIVFKRSEPVTRAAERQADSVVTELANGVERVARTAGWR